MLISLRSKGASWVVNILFGLLIVSFGFWGVPETFRHFQSVPVAATVGGTSITADELRRTFEYNMKNLERRTGKPLDPELVRQLALADKTLDSMIEPTLIEGYGTDLGMVVPDDLLEKAIKSIPSLRDSGGNFSPEALDNHLRARLDPGRATPPSRRVHQFLRAITGAWWFPAARPTRFWPIAPEQRTPIPWRS
jgi:peptidyl-prolyl cis-trans isomerase D